MNHKIVKTAKGFLIVTPTIIPEESAKALLGQLRTSTGEEWAILVGADLATEGLDFAAEWAEFLALTNGLWAKLKSFSQEGTRYAIVIELFGAEYRGSGVTPGEALANLIAFIKPVIEQETK